MKTLLISFMAAVLIASQFIVPVAAAPASAGLASVNCGDTYTVHYFDYLASIAWYCGTSVANILALNPQIVNANLIYAGQVLRLTDGAPVITPVPYYPPPPYIPYTPYTGYARVSLSTTWAAAGTTLRVYASGFPASTEIDFRVGQRGESFLEAYDGKTSSVGTASQTITIPADANTGEYWVVEVITTSLATVTDVFSAPIYITNYNPSTTYTGYARVSLSTTRVAAGGKVTAYVSGFPANTEIDFRAGRRGEDISVVYDGKTGSSGTDSQVITIPTDAVAGEYWVVKVLTTSLKTVTEVTSYSIYITE